MAKVAARYTCGHIVISNIHVTPDQLSGLKRKAKKQECDDCYNYRHGIPNEPNPGIVRVDPKGVTL